MKTDIRELAGKPAEWTSGNIHDVAAYFHCHPKAEGKAAFINLFDSIGADYNRPLYDFLHYWYWKQQIMGGYLRFLSAGLTFEDVAAEVVYFLLTEHDRKWNPAKDKFLPWIEFNLRRHAPIGIRLVKQWKPYKQTEKLEQLLSLSAPVKVPDCDDVPIAELGDLIADICREMEDELSEKDYEELGRAYSLTEIEIFILLIYDEMKEEGASTLAIKKYLNCRLQGRLGHFQSARHLETVIAQLRLKALDFHQQHLYDQ